MTTKDQKPQGARGTETTCRKCGGRKTIEQTKDGKTTTVRCIACRGTGQGSGYMTK